MASDGLQPTDGACDATAPTVPRSALHDTCACVADGCGGDCGELKDGIKVPHDDADGAFDLDAMSDSTDSISAQAGDDSWPIVRDVCAGFECIGSGPFGSGGVLAQAEQTTNNAPLADECVEDSEMINAMPSRAMLERATILADLADFRAGQSAFAVSSKWFHEWAQHACLFTTDVHAVRAAPLRPRKRAYDLVCATDGRSMAVRRTIRAWVSRRAP